MSPADVKFWLLAAIAVTVLTIIAWAIPYTPWHRRWLEHRYACTPPHPGRPVDGSLSEEDRVTWRGMLAHYFDPDPDAEPARAPEQGEEGTL